MFEHPRRRLGISIAKVLVVAGAVLLASGFSPNADARSAALEVELPSVRDMSIKAIKRGSSVMCSARPMVETNPKVTLLADTGKYRGGVWFLEVVSRDLQLEPTSEDVVAYLSLNGQHVATGKALAVGNWVGNKRTETFVRFEFPAIDAYVKDIKTARIVEIQASGFIPLRVESLSPIITALENCQQESLDSEFWKGAENVCN